MERERERGGKGGAARETKVLSVALGTHRCNHGVDACVLTQWTAGQTLCNQGKTGVFMFFCMMNMHTVT